MRILRYFPLLVMLIVLSTGLVVTGCSEDDDATGPVDGTGTVSFTLTDAPFPFDMVAEANVTFDSIAVRMTEDEEGVFRTISSEPGTFNLLELQNGVTATLGSVELETGMYTQVRIYISAATVILTDQREFEMTVPSGAQSGLKVNIQPPLQVNADVDSEVLLDFDVSKSFVVQGNVNSPQGITGFIFRPMLRVVNRSETGRINGTVTVDGGGEMEGALIEVLDADTVLTSTASGVGGAFTILGLPAGTYTVTANSGDTLTASVSDVEVVAGGATPLTLTLTDAAETTSSGTMLVTMTDAPFPFDLLLEANVVIDSVQARVAGDTGNYVLLSDQQQNLNLLDLQGGVTATLGDTLVPAGDYDIIRLYVASANVLLTDSTEYELQVPSGAQTGIKVIIQPALTIVADGESEVLLDFDVSKSFVVQGNANSPAGIRGFLFKPTLRAVNRAATGWLTGTVTDTSDAALFGVTLEVANTDSVITSASTDSSGAYTVLGLIPGDYSVTAQLDGYDDVNEPAVSITGGSETVQNFELTPTSN